MTKWKSIYEVLLDEELRKLLWVKCDTQEEAKSKFNVQLENAIRKGDRLRKWRKTESKSCNSIVFVQKHSNVPRTLTK